MIPGAELGRTNLTTRATSRFGKDNKWTVDAKVQYIHTKADNRPISGSNTSNAFLTIDQLPRSLDILDFLQDITITVICYGMVVVSRSTLTGQKNIRSTDTRDRFLMYSSLKYQFTDWLNAEIKAGTDMYFTDYVNKTYAGSPLTDSGRYNIGQDRFYENNYSFFIVGQKDDILGKWGGAFNIGGNLMSQERKEIDAYPGELLVPNLFTMSNAKSNVSASEYYSRKKRLTLSMELYKLTTMVIYL